MSMKPIDLGFGSFCRFGASDRGGSLHAEIAAASAIMMSARLTGRSPCST
jgi:hypothetical protein